MSHFPGIIPAAITPFTPEDEVDVDGLRANLSHLLEHGMHGFVATGTMGEAGQLSDDERRVVVEICVEVAAGRVPVIVGVSSGAGANTMKYATMARDAGAAAVMCLPPLLYKGLEHEVVEWYRSVARVGLPIMLYNNPEASGIDLTPDAIARIAAEVPEIVAVKECSGDARRIAALLGATDLEILVGGDDWALEGFAAGATGWVSGVANAAPDECRELQALVETGRLPEAREINQRLLPLSRLDMTPKLVQYFKGAMDGVGLRGGVSRPPRLPLNDEESAILAAAMDKLRAPVAA